MFDDNELKYLPANQLVELLSDLPFDAKVYVNKVGNLGIQKADGSWLGFVDFAEGKIEYDEEEIINQSL